MAGGVDGGQRGGRRANARHARRDPGARAPQRRGCGRLAGAARTARGPRCGRRRGHATDRAQTVAAAAAHRPRGPPTPRRRRATAPAGARRRPAAAADATLVDSPSDERRRGAGRGATAGRREPSAGPRRRVPGAGRAGVLRHRRAGGQVRRGAGAGPGAERHRGVRRARPRGPARRGRHGNGRAPGRPGRRPGAAGRDRRAQPIRGAAAGLGHGAAAHPRPVRVGRRRRDHRAGCATVSSGVLPVRSALARRAAPARPWLVGELAVVALLVFAYDRVRAHAAPRRDVALSHGWAVLHAEQHLHLDWEHAANTWLGGHSTLREAAAWWYQLAHFTVSLSVLAWCWLAAPAVYRLARNTLVLTNVVGLIVFAVCPVAPPRLLPGAGFTDSNAVALGTGQVAHPPPDQYAAMPSLHLAWATWVALTVWAVTGNLGRLRGLRAAGIAVPVLTLVASGAAEAITARSNDAPAQQEREHATRRDQRQPHGGQPIGDDRADR